MGIHVVVSQAALNEWTIGDSHEYRLAVNIFDKLVVNRLILEYAKTYLCVPTLEIAEHWHDIYAKPPELPVLRCRPAKGVPVITLTAGIGMTMCFGLAEQTLGEMEK